MLQNACLKDISIFNSIEFIADGRISRLNTKFKKVKGHLKLPFSMNEKEELPKNPRTRRERNKLKKLLLLEFQVE